MRVKKDDVCSAVKAVKEALHGKFLHNRRGLQKAQRRGLLRIKSTKRLKQAWTAFDKATGHLASL